MQDAKKEELECKLRLETARMESERIKLQKKIKQAQMEDEIAQMDNEIYQDTAKESEPPRITNKEKLEKETKKKTANKDNTDVLEVMMKLADLHTAPDADSKIQDSKHVFPAL